MSSFQTKDRIVRWLSRLSVHESEITFTSMQEVKVEKKSRHYYKEYETHEQAGVKYSYKGKDYLLTCKKECKYGENLKFLEILIHSRVIGIERGIETLEQAFAGYTALTFSSTPRAILGVAETATKEQCEDAFRRWAKTSHPDVGGSPEQFARVNKAIQEIRGSP